MGNNSDSIENSNNIILQISAEFHALLFAINYKSSNKWIHNALLDSQRLHMRTLLFFFSNSNKIYPDDLQYFDIISTKSPDLEIAYDDDLRKFINKQAAHITKSRGKLNFDRKKYLETRALIVDAIEKFLKLLPNYIKPEYKAQLESDDAQHALGAIHWQLIHYRLDHE